MEIYAASKREQSAPAKPKAGTGKRSAAATAADAYHFYDRGVVVGDKSGIVLEIRYVGIVIFHSGKNG